MFFSGRRQEEREDYMKKVVITIARYYGSGGRTVGKMLSQDLNIPLYDREILQLASDDSGISEEMFAKVDEKVRGTALFRIARKAYDGTVIPPGGRVHLRMSAEVNRPAGFCMNI